MVRNDIRIRYMYYSYGCIKKCTLSNPWYQILCSVVRPYISKVTHKSIFPAQYSEFASVQLEYMWAPVVVRQAYDRGIIFSGLVCEGDNKTIEALKEAQV